MACASPDEGPFLRAPDTYTVVRTDDPTKFVTLSSFADGDVSIGSIEMVEIEIEDPPA